ncbi:MAG: hypothetical protein WDA20_02060 [Desulfuromonadales bacterium]
MPDGIFTLATVTISGLFGLLVALTTSRVSREHEKLVLKVRLKNEKIESIKTLLVDAISALDATIRGEGMGDKDHEQRITTVSARLRLLTEPEIFSQFEKAGNAIDLWAAQYKKGQPRQLSSGVSIISSGDSEHQKKAVTMFENVEREMDAFVSLSRMHINKLEKET